MRDAQARRRPAPRRQRRALRSHRRLLTVAAGGIALAIAALIGVHTVEPATASRSWPTAHEALDRIAAAVGLGIRQVEIRGHSFTSDRSIHDTLDLRNVRSLVSLDSKAVRARIERLPWVDTATVTRVFPDRLAIVISERRPLARWQRGERVHLIDATGRVLSAIQPHAADHLPLVAGEGAELAAGALLALLSGYPELAQRLDVAERIEGRRWSLKLAGGLTALLPTEGEPAALARLASADVLQGLAATSAATVDLRQPDRVIVRRGTSKPSPAPGKEHDRAQSG